MSVVVVAFKEEDCEEAIGPCGPVVAIRWASETPKAAGALQAGLPFPHESCEARHLGWKGQREAAGIAAEHGVKLAYS